MYQEGEGGLLHDDAKATDFLIKSANQMFFKAQYALAFQYEIGDGVPRSRQKAIELFRASGDGIAIADALADPNAPASFKDMIAFARYLSSLRNAEEAASWQAWLDYPAEGQRGLCTQRLWAVRGRDVGMGEAPEGLIRASRIPKIVGQSDGKHLGEKSLHGPQLTARGADSERDAGPIRCDVDPARADEL